MALCFCGHPAVTRTSWTDVNPGRRFLACPQLNGERCIYFDWVVDPPMCQRDMMIIPGLLRVRNMMEADMMVLVQANRNLKKYLIFSSLAFAFFLLLS
ncbi:zinc finger, GRF-type containing protein [Tanacetum coccineum]